MPVLVNNGAEDFRRRVESFKAGIKEGLPIIGEIARDEIVRSTLAGIAEGDAPFAPYSKAYAELVEAAGGKTGGVVDLRGIFVHSGTKKAQKEIATRDTSTAKALKKEAARQKRLLRKGGFRRAFIRVSVAGKSFFAQTKPTRQRRGLLDPDSEMSTDLIKIKPSRDGTAITLIYSPRHEEYMIWHNEGDGNNPQRIWFSLEKSNVKGAVEGSLAELFRALIADFNR